MKTFAKKAILVTGGTGFVGSHLVEALVNEGAHVVVPYVELDPRSYFVTQGLDKHVILCPADLTDRGRVSSLINNYEIKIIFHLGAQAIVANAYRNPVEAFETNLMGTVNVLEAARQYGKVEAIVVTSSDKAYGKSDKPYVEEDPLCGDHPYEASKAAADLAAQTYAKTYGLPVTVTRFGNIYGEGDLNFTRIIPGMMKAMVEGATLELRSDGAMTRDYVYVKDAISGILALALNIDQTRGEAYNFTSHEHLSVLDLLAKAEEIVGQRIHRSIRNDAVNEIPNQRLNDDKIRKSLGWKSVHTLTQTLPQIYQWYKKILTKS